MYYFCFECYGDLRDLHVLTHSFPIRRSSDLQHLIRSIVAIRNDGGVVLKNGKRVMPDPILVGRSLDKVAALASKYGIERYTDDLDAALKNKRSEEHTSELQSLMRISYAVFCLKTKKHSQNSMKTNIT